LAGSSGSLCFWLGRLRLRGEAAVGGIVLLPCCPGKKALGCSNLSGCLMALANPDLVSAVKLGMLEWHVFCWVEEKLVFFRKKGGFFFFWGVFFAWWGLGGFSFFACCFWN